MIYIFYLSLFLIIYHYVIYPVATVYAAQIKQFSAPASESDPYRGCSDFQPTVSLIIAAYNEEKVIEKKIINSLSLDYPRDKIQIIIVSDGSNDSTAEIADSYKDQGILGLHQDERQGKTAALNRAVEHATGEYLVFSDANNDFNELAIKKLITPFQNPEIGGVNGVKRIRAEADRASSAGDGLYWIYESTLKQAESDLGTITGADGEIFAMRKSLFVPIDTSVINDDAAITFNIIKNKFRIIYQKDAVSYESASIKLADDFRVKQRMVAGGFQTVSREFSFLVPPKSLFSFQYLSHKLLRWLMPEFFITLFIASLLEYENSFVLITLIAQLVAYSIVGLAWLRSSETTLSRPVYFIYYFFLMNAAALWGFLHYIKGSQTNLWHKAQR